MPALDEPTRQQLSAHLERIELPAGARVIQEGATDRAMFFVLSGEASVRRGEVQVGSLRPGDHFGEAALVLGEVRGASVYAVRPLALAQLSLEAYQQLGADKPEVAHRLLEQLLFTANRRLAEMTESVTVLIKGRSLPRRAEVRVWVRGQAQDVKNGTQVQELLPKTVNDSPVIAASLDHRLVSLNTRITGDCTLEPLTTAHWEGRRALYHSLALLLQEAARVAIPEHRVYMGASVGFAQRVILSPPVAREELPELAARLDATMRALCGEDRPLQDEHWGIEEAREYFSNAGDHDAAELLTMRRSPTVALISYGQRYALRMGTLAPRTGLLSGFQIMAGDDALILLYERNTSKAIAAFNNATSLVAGAESGREQPATTMDLMNEARAISRRSVILSSDHSLWLGAMGVTSVGAFNRACVDGSVSQLIRVSEGAQERRIANIADEIAARRGQTRLVCIAGPSSSGKTTFIERLSVQLQVNGLNPINLSLDDYYRDREDTPRLPSGEYDFEGLHALQIELLQEHLTRLSFHQEVHTPRYDFSAGKSHLQGGRRLQLGDSDILMLEGIHGLNPAILGEADPERAYRIFVCPMAQLPFDRTTRVHASDVRLIRRIVRDRHGRNLTAAETIRRWPAVREGERSHIFPFQVHADTTFDSSLIYELAVLKVYAERYLLEIPRNHPALTTSVRLLRMLDYFVPIYSEHVPQNSLLREFIGGSAFS